MSSTRLYVGNLSEDARESDIWTLFRGYKVREVLWKGNFAFVEFQTRQEMRDALDNLNGSRIVDRRIRLEKAKIDDPLRQAGAGRSQRINSKSPARLMVRNLSSSLTWSELKNHIRRWLEPLHVDCNHRTPGEGEVLLKDGADLRYLLKHADGHSLHGRKLVFFEPSRTPRRGHSPYRSRYRSSSPPRRNRSPRRRSRSPSLQSTESVVSQNYVKRYTSDSEIEVDNLSPLNKAAAKTTEQQSTTSARAASREPLEHDESNPYSNFFGSSTSEKKTAGINGKSQHKRHGSDSVQHGTKSKSAKYSEQPAVCSASLRATIDSCLFLDRTIEAALAEC